MESATDPFQVVRPKAEGVEGRESDPAVRHPVPEAGGSRLIPIHHRHQLQVVVAEGDYAVGRPMPRMLSPGYRSQAELPMEPLGRPVQVLDPNYDVVYLQSHRRDDGMVPRPVDWQP